ncbi:DUF1351 domain-containing protein [Staphylococcus succinus]|uniref:DUF1351 domain-containing protein n=1 Tax=Staphylococcus succinus TaxID=61015 RepID=UPI00301DE0F8
MNNPLMKKHDYDITTVEGQVIFADYDNILEEAQNLATHVKQVYVNDENLKESKKLVSTMNKRVTEMNDKRKEVKNAVLKPYVSFEQQVKNIESVVRDAENHVRTQVRDLAEQERNEKRKEIADIYDMRIQHYDFESLMGFADFIENKHLNKSYSISKVEDDLVQWLERTRQDLQTIDKVSKDDSEYKNDLIIEYQETQNISKAIDNVENAREQRRKVAEQSKQRELQAKRDARRVEDEANKEVLYNITVPEGDYNLVLEFLKRNKIDYKAKKLN